jgi:hypothetical protein
MTYKINFHQVNSEQSRKGLIINAQQQAKVWVIRDREEGNSKDYTYIHVAEKMKDKYPELTKEERKDIILKYL